MFNTTAMAFPALLSLRHHLQKDEYEVIDVTKTLRIGKAQNDRDLPRITRNFSEFSLQAQDARKRAQGDLDRRHGIVLEPSDEELMAMILHPFFSDLGCFEREKRKKLGAHGQKLLEQKFNELEQARLARAESTEVEVDTTDIIRMMFIDEEETPPKRPKTVNHR